MAHTTKYFAAANGYDGFVSYFNKVFDPADFSGIYILKGGPGTGKSSMMRRISTALSSREAICQEILCSSDKSSLDGVICEKGERRVAVIDGTAPHERDTLLPGACDELINLGDGWDKRWLAANRDQIEKLGAEKKNAYNTAYSYLRIAGVADRGSRHYSVSEECAKKVETAAKSLADRIKYKTGKTSTRLISSFGKSGAYRLDTLETIADKRYTLLGSYAYTSIFTRCVFDTLRECRAEMIISPSPLEAKDTEALFIGGDNVVISRDSGGEIIDLREITATDTLNEERIKSMREIESTALENATRWFSIASDLHFRLEEIYKRSMDFERNEEITEEKIEEISQLLEL